MCNKPAPAQSASENAAAKLPLATRYCVGDCVLLCSGEAGRLVALSGEADGDNEANAAAFAQVRAQHVYNSYFIRLGPERKAGAAFLCRRPDLDLSREFSAASRLFAGHNVRVDPQQEGGAGG